MNKKPIVLIVDDTPSNIKVLNDLLKDKYKIHVSTSGKDALELVDQEVPDIILLDIKMPEMDGYEVCRRLKSSDKTSKTPIIFITAKSDEVDEQHGLELGAVDYISKPFSPSIVRIRISNHLELKGARDNLEELVEARTRELRLTNDKLAMYIKELEGKAELTRLQTSGVGQADAAVEICRIINDVIGASQVILFYPHKKTKDLVPIVVFDPDRPEEIQVINAIDESSVCAQKELATKSMNQEKLICGTSNDLAAPLIFNNEILGVVWVSGLDINCDGIDNLEVLQRIANEAASSLRWVRINEDVLFDQMDLNEILGKS